MERTLIRLLEATSIYFVPFGPTIEHRGISCLATWTSSQWLARVRRDNPGCPTLHHLDGKLCAATGEERAARRLAAS